MSPLRMTTGVAWDEALRCAFGTGRKGVEGLLGGGLPTLTEWLRPTPAPFSRSSTEQHPLYWLSVPA